MSRLRFAAIGGRNLLCRVCRRERESPPESRETWAMMEGVVEKGPVHGLIKAERQQRYPECASCRSDMQKKLGLFSC